MASAAAAADLAATSNPQRVVTLYCVRHGETDWNAAGRLQGQYDTPLNDKGRAQAAAAGAYLADALRGRGAAVPVYSSDLLRTSETAAAIAAALGSPAVRSDARLRETHLGAWQGRTWDEVAKNDAHAVNAWKTDPDAPPPGGGEAVRTRFRRVVLALHDIALRHDKEGGDTGGAVVVVVTHGGVLDDVGRFVNGVPFGKPTGLRKHNTSINVVTFARPRGLGLAVPLDSLEASFPPLSTEPVTARTLHGSWALQQWGITTHLGSEVDAQPWHARDHASSGGGAAMPTALSAAAAAADGGAAPISAEEDAVSSGV